MLSDYRHWLEYDSVVLTVLLVGIGFVELIGLTLRMEDRALFNSRLRAENVLRTVR